MFPIAARTQLSRTFSTSAARFLAVGDKIPSASLFEGSPGNEVNLAEEATGKAVVVGIPGAYSPACLASHVPGYVKNLEQFKQKGYDSIYVVSVNDAFVMKAWGEELCKSGEVRFLADPKGQFSKEWKVLFDASKFFGNLRAGRFAALVDGGVVTKAFVEPDYVSVDVSSAESVLKSIE